MLATQRRDDLKDGVLIVLALFFLAFQVLYLLHQMKVIALPLPWEKNGGNMVMVIGGSEGKFKVQSEYLKRQRKT